MKTPYDTALRMLQRQVDEMRSSIEIANKKAGEIEQSQHRVSEAIHKESVVASGDWAIMSHAYFARVRAERQQLAFQRTVADRLVDQLRSQAGEVYGSMRAMETAAGQFRDEQVRIADTAEQARIDDTSGAQFASAIRAARRPCPGREIGR